MNIMCISQSVVSCTKLDSVNESVNNKTHSYNSLNSKLDHLRTSAATTLINGWNNFEPVLTWG